MNYNTTSYLRERSVPCQRAAGPAASMGNHINRQPVYNYRCPTVFTRADNVRGTLFDPVSRVVQRTGYHKRTYSCLSHRKHARKIPRCKIHKKKEIPYIANWKRGGEYGIVITGYFALK